MIELAYDLHIHSCLSPCGDDECTPASIAGLAMLLELDVVALTDHNTCKNCPAFFEAANNYGILPIAGMELSTEEEIHVLCLFPTLEDAMAFDEVIYEKLFPMANDAAIFGNQLVMDCEDNITGTVEKSLIGATSIDLYSLAGLVEKYDGLIIPAHIERKAFSLISALGAVPDDCGFDCVEIRSIAAVDNLKLQHPYLNNCQIIHNSDAHLLENISTAGNKLIAYEKTAKSVLCALSEGYRRTYEG